MRVRQTVVEARQVFVADRVRKRRWPATPARARSSRCSSPQLRDVMRLAWMPSASRDRRGALRDPDREHERETRPRLPRLAKIVRERVCRQRCVRRSVHDPRSCVAAQDAARRRRSPAARRAHRGRSRRCRTSPHRPATNSGRAVPHVLEQQLEQRDARHRAAADDHALSVELRGRAAREQHDALHRAVAGDARDPAAADSAARRAHTRRPRRR